MTISRMRRQTPFEPTDPSVCSWSAVADIINCAKFFENRFSGYGAGRPGKWHIPLTSFIAHTLTMVSALHYCYCSHITYRCEMLSLMEVEKYHFCLLYSYYSS